MAIVACAIVHSDPPQVFIAEDESTLNWVLALHLIAKTPAKDLPDGLADVLRRAIIEERWGDAVFDYMLWASETIDVYPSFDLYEAHHVELAQHEVQFSPLFRD